MYLFTNENAAAHYLHHYIFFVQNIQQCCAINQTKYARMYLFHQWAWDYLFQRRLILAYRPMVAYLYLHHMSIIRNTCRASQIMDAKNVASYLTLIQRNLSEWMEEKQQGVESLSKLTHGQNTYIHRTHLICMHLQ